MKGYAKMKKFLALALALCMIFALCACGQKAAPAEAPAEEAAPAAEEAAAPAAEKAADAIVLKIGISTNEEDPRAKGALQFIGEITEKTNGAVTGKLYPAGQLGGDADLINSLVLDAGTVDIIITDNSNFATLVPNMGISALPFLFNSFEEAWEFCDGPIEAAAEAGLIPNNIRVLAHYDNGFRCVTNSKAPVETPENMKGMLIRTPENPVIMATMTALGANPQPLAFNELYQALQQGTYDAQENPIPVIYNNKLYEVQKYLSVTNHIYSGMCFAIAESVWQKLTTEQQEIVQAAATSSAVTDREMNKQQTNDYVANLESEGMKINYPDLSAFAEASKSVIESNKDIDAELLAQLNEWLASK